MKIHKGGCHCGKVRYEVEGNIENAMSCNCSHCGKKGFLLHFVPADKFKLEKGEENLSEYRFNTKKIQHLFCKDCGVQSFGRGKGEHGPTVAVNVRCLDDVDLTTLTVTPYDGKSK
jgi:hypothetical protein